MPVSCPECLHSPCDAIEREVVPEGLRTTFECDSCGHLWDVLF